MSEWDKLLFRKLFSIGDINYNRFDVAFVCVVFAAPMPLPGWWLLLAAPMAFCIGFMSQMLGTIVDHEINKEKKNG